MLKKFLILLVILIPINSIASEKKTTFVLYRLPVNTEIGAVYSELFKTLKNFGIEALLVKLGACM